MVNKWSLTMMHVNMDMGIKCESATVSHLFIVRNTIHILCRAALSVRPNPSIIAKWIVYILLMCEYDEVAQFRIHLPLSHTLFLSSVQALHIHGWKGKKNKTMWPHTHKNRKWIFTQDLRYDERQPFEWETVAKAPKSLCPTAWWIFCIFFILRSEKFSHAETFSLAPYEVI